MLNLEHQHFTYKTYKESSVNQKRNTNDSMVKWKKNTPQELLTGTSYKKTYKDILTQKKFSFINYKNRN